MNTSVNETALQSAALGAEERDFVEKTRRLLLWEQKAWRIAAIAFLILGIVVFVICAIGAAVVWDQMHSLSKVYDSFYDLYGDYGYSGTRYDTLGLFYAIYFLFLGVFDLVQCGVLFVAGQIAASKIDQYTETIDTAFEETEKRLSCVGIMVIAILFNCIALIFFAINRARILSSPETVARIKKSQA